MPINCGKRKVRRGREGGLKVFRYHIVPSRGSTCQTKCFAAFKIAICASVLSKKYINKFLYTQLANRDGNNNTECLKPFVAVASLSNDSKIYPTISTTDKLEEISLTTTK